MKIRDTIEFFGPENILSNYAPCKIVYHGREYYTSEHLYQARKYRYRNCTDANIAYSEEIRRCNTPNKAKRLAQKKRGGRYKWEIQLNEIIDGYPDSEINPRWDEIKIVVMKHVLKLKFEQSEKFRKKLMNTGNSIIIEKSPYDYFWGVGADGNGQNMLGKLLMKLRDLQ